MPHLTRLSRLCRGRPRPCSRRLPATGAVFVFLSKSLLRSQAPIRTYRYISICCYCSHVRNRLVEQVAFTPSAVRSLEWSLFFCCVACFHLFFFWHRVCFHNRVLLGPDELYCTTCMPGMNVCMQSVAAAVAAVLCVAILVLLLLQQCCCFLLLFVIVCRMANFVADSLNLIPVSSFSSFQHD